MLAFLVDSDCTDLTDFLTLNFTSKNLELISVNQQNQCHNSLRFTLENELDITN